MKTSEKLRAALCDPDGKVSFYGAMGDRIIVSEAIREVEEMEKAIESLNQVNKSVIFVRRGWM